METAAEPPLPSPAPGSRRRPTGAAVWALLLLLAALSPGAEAAPSRTPSLQPIAGFALQPTEVTIGQFRAFVQATGTRTAAERAGGGYVYEGGWVRKGGWIWSRPYGTPGRGDEPAVHVTFPEAAAFCAWAGWRLPTDEEWVAAAYTERRPHPPAPFRTGRTYIYPTGDSPEGANCLDDCGPTAPVLHGASLSRGQGHAAAQTTRRGVNGLWEMGGNIWEWVEGGTEEARRTRGGSWWYGATQMRADFLTAKPPDFPALYIGFRCAASSP